MPSSSKPGKQAKVIQRVSYVSDTPASGMLKQRKDDSGVHHHLPPQTRPNSPALGIDQSDAVADKTALDFAMAKPDQSLGLTTPPKPPAGQLSNPFELRELVEAVRSLAPPSSVKSLAPIQQTVSTCETIQKGSKLETKEVHEVWDPIKYAYQVVESPPIPELTVLDQYCFVVRNRRPRHDDDFSRPVVYVDFKSAALWYIVKGVLKGIKWLSMGDETPSVERDLLFHHLSQLKEIQKQGDCNSKALEALKLLTSTIEGSYQSTSADLASQIRQGVVSYPLLWALFKPNAHVIAICQGSRKEKCLRYEMGMEKKTMQGVEYFELQCQYFDYDGSILGSVMEKLKIEKFHGVVPIDSLQVVPLDLHARASDIRSSLAARGRKFLSFSQVSHQFYDGLAFYQKKESTIRRSIKSRIIIDVKQFRKNNPSYPKFSSKEIRQATGLLGQIFAEEQQIERVTNNDLNAANICDDDLLLFAPTLMGFSLNDKFWGEFAVDDVEIIDWPPNVLLALDLPPTQKKVILASTHNHLAREDRSHYSATTLVEKSGQGLRILLQGPPGVGKTMTAETLAEHYRRPLYSVSVGELSSDAAELEEQLNIVFQTAGIWNALLLLDEADVFLQSRAALSLERNRLVGVFLRKLESFTGVLFLTTNLPDDLDVAILDRLHLKLKYGELDRNGRKAVFKSILGGMVERRNSVNISESDIDRFVSIHMNGREIRNTLYLAANMAAAEQEDLGSSHVSAALAANGRLVPDFVSDSANDLYES